MKILALESSAFAASVAICEGEKLIAETFLNTGFTHSETLLPMVETILISAGLSMSNIDLIGVATGPGSFTGLRIGVSVAKGLAWAKDLPCAACSTLESMAWNASVLEGEICTAMDARRGQVYHARFRSDGRNVLRLTEDQAISLEDLSRSLMEDTVPLQLVLGDGAQICFDALTGKGVPARLAPQNLRVQSAWGVARVALEQFHKRSLITGEELKPLYLRLSQAERERLQKENRR